MDDPRTKITDEWLLSVDFKWSQSERQPNKHYTLKVNQFGRDGRHYSTAAIELQRCGWTNRKGDYIGNPEHWMLWLTDQFDSRAFVGHIEFIDQISQLAELVSGHPWNPANHIWGQTWPDDRHAREKE